MRSLLRFLLLCLPVTALGCGPSDHVVLLHLRSQQAVETIDIEVTSIDTPIRGPLRRRVNQRVDDPNDIRVLIRLEGSALIRVHVVGRTASDERLVATRCYTVDGVVEDDAVLVLLAELDADGDSYPSNASAVCAEPDGETGSRPCNDGDVHVCADNRAQDCDDTDRNVFPGANVICQNGLDEDCDGEDELCADNDGDGVAACAPGTTDTCDCDDSDPTVSPSADETPEMCNDGIDQNCDGVDRCCDNDGDGVTLCNTCLDRAGVPAERVGERCLDDEECSPIDAMTGRPTMIINGSCTTDPTGMGDCDDTNPNVAPGRTEECDGEDNNCNGLIDELSECRGPDLDNDGSPLCGHPDADPMAECEQRETECDAGQSHTNREQCGDGVDNDLDPSTPDACPAGDTDMDGQAPPMDCDDMNPLAYERDGMRLPDIDNCGDMFPNNCMAGGDRACAEDLDGDTFVEIHPAYCEGNMALNPMATEVCDGLDNDCDLVTDEVLGDTSRVGCAEGAALDFFSDDFLNCGGCRLGCTPTTDADQCVMGVCDCSAEPGTGGCIDILTARLGGAPADPVCDSSLGCIDRATDVNNCGEIGHACGPGQTCMGGMCRCGPTQGLPADMRGGDSDLADACQPIGPMECCNDVCVNIEDDEQNCGRCDYRCGPRTVCGARVCRCDPGQPDFEDCDGDAAANGGNGCETNTNVPNNAHCGACGNNCTPNAVCNASLVCECNTGQLDCMAGRPWCETPFTTANCGACGATCGASEGCNGGRCECGGTSAGVGAGEACVGAANECCGGTCRDTNTLENHCGACNVSCGNMETCGGGRCSCSGEAGAGGVGAGERCTGAQGECCPGDGCVNLNNDRTNCGACGVTCGTSETCGSGQCRCMGQSGGTSGGPRCTGAADTCCPGAGCIDTDTNRNHCGGCGIACGAGESCMGGECRCAGEGSGGGVGMGPVCGGGQRCCPSGSAGCVNLTNNNSHCGACDTACGAAETCSASECTCGPSGGGGVGAGPRCGGPANTCCPALGCRNLSGDATSCGACGVACGTGEGCSGGQCQCPGEGGGGGVGMGPHCGATAPTCCGGTAGCVNTADEEAHCGACNTACGTMETCGSGRCECGTSVGGPGAGGVCGGLNPPTCCPADMCVDTTNDPSHCGGCGMACTAGSGAMVSGCSGSSCTFACVGRNLDCDADPSDCEQAEDDNNCGACGVQCAPGASCFNGSCHCNNMGGDVCFDGVEGDGCMGTNCRCGGAAACVSPQTCSGGACG